MIDPDECRQNARDCESWAKLASTNSDRQQFLAMAASWACLAQAAHSTSSETLSGACVILQFARRANSIVARV
jgi:hypothetical protein